MTKIDLLLRNIQKDHLLFKRKKKELSLSRVDKLGAIVPENTFWPFDSFVSESIWFRFTSESENAGSKLFQERNPKRKLNLASRLNNLNLLSTDVVRIADEQEVVFLFPQDWNIAGSYLIRTHTLFENIDAISYQIEDAFTIFDIEMEAMLEIEVDRNRRNETSHVVINATGRKFEAYLDGLDYSGLSIN